MAVKKRARKKTKQKPKIEYPPVPTKTWVPPDQRPKKEKPPPAYVKPEGVTQKLKISSLQKIWNQYVVYGHSAVLLGHYSQTYKKYTFKTNGYQGACNCAVACTFAYIYKMNTWSRYFLDRILDLGDDLYLKSIQQEKGKCLTLVPPELVFNSFYLDRAKVLLNINVGPKVAETLPTVTEQKVKQFIGNAVEKFFKMYASGIFSLLEKYLAIWIQDEAYYVFDPTDHDNYGNTWTGVPGNGLSVLFRSKTIEDMVENICKNVNAKIPHTKFEIIECTVSRITNVNTKPPESFEKFMENEVVETRPVGPDEDVEGVKPIDVLKEKLIAYLEADKTDKADTSSIMTKIEEISPDVTKDLPPSKRPSWLQGDINKNDLGVFAIPRKPKLDKISFYIEVLPEKIYILRASTCQTDKKFSKYGGRQSMGNAISSLIMLRFYKSKVWVPRILNTILKYGDLLYNDAMKSIPRTQSLKLSDFQRKTEYEKKNFSPVIHDYVVVGKLQSLDFDVLDLLPALENFLLDHDCCVVLGPITLAIWVEDGYFYWFDPNDRDKQGKVVTKCKTIAGETIELDYTPGVACVIRFHTLKDLVDLYMFNVDKPQKFDPFYLSSVKINDYVEIPDDWNQFKGLIPGKWILRGTKMQASKKYPKDSRNYQSPANSLAALAFRTLIEEKDWTTEIVDEILDLGDQLYNKSIESLKSSEKFVSKMLTISEVAPAIELRKKQANFEIGECCVNGIINAKKDDELKNLKRGLEEFFEDNDLGVVTSHNISVAVWKKGGIFFMFDSHPRDEKGLATNHGTACVLRMLDVDELAKSLEMNLSPGKEDFYNISWVKVKLCEIQDGIIRPPLNHYTKISNDCAILRSLFSEISPKYDINCRKQTVPMGLMALAYNKLKPSKEWTKADMDEIINKGNDYYTDTMNDVMKEELKLEDEDEEEDQQQSGEQPVDQPTSESPSEPTSAEGTTAETVEEEGLEDEEEIMDKEDGIVSTTNVNKEFHIGLNKMTVEFEDVAEGNIKESLTEALKTFFEREQTDEDFSQEAILESKPLTVTLWRDDKVFYYFDPKPRDSTGKVIGATDWKEYEPSVKDAEGAEDEQDQLEEAEQEEEGIPTKGSDDGNNDTDKEGEEDVEKMGSGDYEKSDEEMTETTEPETEAKEDKMETNEEETETKEQEESSTAIEKDEEIGPDKKDKGTVPPQVASKSPSFWREQEKKGRACTMWFTKLDDFINHIKGNISSEASYKNDFALKSVNMVNTAALKARLKPEDTRSDVYAGDWYDFQELDHGKWIMRGSMNLKNEMFPEENRGKQQITTSLVALAITHAFTMLCFDKYTVDTMLIYGDKLYTFMKRSRKKILKRLNLKDDEIDWLVQHEEYDLRDVVKKICIWKFYVDIGVEEDYLTGDINSEVEDIYNVERGLQEFFSQEKYGLLQCKDLTVAIWRGQKIFYMFDGMNRGPNGIVSPNGTACITRFLQLSDLSKVFLANLPEFGRNAFTIHKVFLMKDLCTRAREPKELRDNPNKKGVTSGGYRKVVAGKCIVRGNISIQDPKFTRSPSLLAAPIAIIALTMSLIHKPNTWSKPIVDDILELGAELSDESINEMGYEFNPWEETLDISRVKNDYTIGVLKANCEFRNRDQKGIIDSKSEYSINLRQGIEQFFEENTHGVLTTANLILAMWEEEEDTPSPLIYMFDPNPRGPTGMPLDTGTACVMTFVNAKVAADHIMGCILDPNLKKSEFNIVPVEIVVGNTRTIRKLKKTTTSEVGVLPRCSKLVADEEKKLLRKIDADARKRKEAKEQQKIGRNGYYLMKNGDALLRGYRSQNSTNYNENSRNNQDITNCILAIVMNKILSIENWTYKHIDLILDAGDQLYIDSYIAYNPKDKKLGLENIMRKFFFKNMEIHITVYKHIIKDVFNVSNINRILNVFLQQEPVCMLSFMDQWVSIFTKSGFYYVFDPHERNIEGNTIKEGEEGTAVVVKFDDINSLALKVVQNLYVEQEEIEKDFYLWLISVEYK